MDYPAQCNQTQCNSEKVSEKQVGVTLDQSRPKHAKRENKDRGEKKPSSALSAPSFIADINSNHSWHCNSPQEVITP